MKCNWSYNKIKCERDSYEGSEFCLFHKPKKNKEEAKIFWAVINFNPYNQVSEQNIKALYNIFSYDGAGEKNNKDILKYFLKNGMVRHHLNNNQKITLNKEIELSISVYFANIGLEKRVEKLVLEQWKNSRIHGFDSGVFSGFVFPSGGFFNYKYGLLNQGNTFFFDNVVFESECLFENYNFEKNNVHFVNMQLVGPIMFENAIFNGNVLFENTNLNTVHNYMGRYPFFNTKFNGQELTFKGGVINNIYGIILSENTSLIIKDDVEVSMLRFGNIFGSMVNAEKETYLIAKKQATRRGEYKQAGEYFYLERDAEKKQIISSFKQDFRKSKKIEGKVNPFRYLINKSFYLAYYKFLWNLFSKHTIGYGERPLKALVSSGLFIFIFGLTYYSCNLLPDSSFINSMYFSISSYVTIGFGDKTPISLIGKLISSFEMFVGVTFIAFWTATIIKKMMR